MQPYRRILLAVVIGLLSAGACYAHKAPVGHAGDFMWPYRAAQLLRNDVNPYRVPLPDLPYDPDAPLYYPLPTVLVAVPLSFLPPVLAGSLFIGLSATLLAWTLQRDGRWRLWIVLSAPWWWAIAANQWSLLLTAAVLTPVLQGLAALKPNLGIGILVYQPRWQPLLLGAVVAVLISLLVLPTWPLDWSVNLQRNRHHVPLLLLPFGPLLLLTATRWHNPRAVSLRTRLFSAAGAWLRSGCPWSRGALGIPTIGVSVAQLAARRRGISAWQATNMDTAGGVRTGCSYRHLAHIVAARRPPTSAEWRQHG